MGLKACSDYYGKIIRAHRPSAPACIFPPICGMIPQNESVSVRDGFTKISQSRLNYIHPENRPFTSKGSSHHYLGHAVRNKGPYMNLQRIGPYFWESPRLKLNRIKDQQMESWRGPQWHSPISAIPESYESEKIGTELAWILPVLSGICGIAKKVEAGLIPVRENSFTEYPVSGLFMCPLCRCVLYTAWTELPQRPTS